jgi:hypothetical protein
MCSRAYWVQSVMGVREVLWLKKVVYTPTHQLQVTSYCGSVSALAFLRAAIPKVPDRTGNIDVQYWFGRDHVMKGSIVLRFIATDEMLADGLTKPYSGPEMQTYPPEIGMHGFAMKGLEKEEKEGNLEVVVLTSCLALLAPIISTVTPSVPPLPLDMCSLP